MSRKKKAPIRSFLPDPKFKSVIIPKLINSLMFDGRKTTAERIVYDAIDKLKTKSKEEPIKIFNEAINNLRPTVEVRSRRVGGATYQVPVEVRSKRAQALAIRWLISASRKRKDKLMKFLTLIKTKALQLKKKKMYIKWQNQTKHLLILGGNNLWLEHIL